MNYVSCSPYRIPIARLAAAQAVVNEKEEFAKDKGQGKSESEKSKVKSKMT